MREFVIEIDGREGGKEEAIVVTTMTDPAIPQKEISDLYWTRWNCELDIRVDQAFARTWTFCDARRRKWFAKKSGATCWPATCCAESIVESAKRNDVLPRQLSVKGAMQAVESFTPAMMAIDGNDAIYDAMLATVRPTVLAIGPGD